MVCDIYFTEVIALRLSDDVIIAIGISLNIFSTVLGTLILESPFNRGNVILQRCLSHKIKACWVNKLQSGN
jgi:hypothetical protein